MSRRSEPVRAVLERARAAGFLGPGEVDPHLDHARGFVGAAEAGLGRRPERFCDLGTGGGLPGLVLAVDWPDARGVLLDSSRRRCAALREAVAELGLAARIEVVELRAEAAAREPTLRETFDAVTARAFAGPAVTAEIAAAFVQVGGIVVVSEPPHPDPLRWPADRLASLGLGPARALALDTGHFAVLLKTDAAPASAPRGVGRPGKRPLW